MNKEWKATKAVDPPPRRQPAVNEWLTASEAAQYLKVKVRTILLWARESKIKAYALSGTKRRVWRFRTADLDAAMMLNCVSPSVPSTERRIV